MKIEKFFKTAVSFFPGGVLSAVLLFAAAGCFRPEEKKVPANPLWTVWHSPKAPVLLRISFTPDGRLVGVMGVNNFFAPVRYLPDGVEIDDVAVSSQTDEPEFAPRFFKALRSARYTVISGDRLILYDRSRKKVMTLERLAR